MASWQSADGEDIRMNLARSISLLLIAAAGGAAAQLVWVLHEPQQWLLVPNAWMGTMAVQRLLHVVAGMRPILWAAVWALLGMELDALIVRRIRKKSFRLDRISFAALWLFFYLGVPVMLSRHFSEHWPTVFLDKFPYSVAPLAAAAALAGHAVVVVIMGGRQMQASRSFAVVVSGAVTCLAAIFANVYWLPEALSTVSLVWTAAIFIIGMASAAALWRIDAPRLERALQSLSDACLRRPAFPALLLAAVLLATMASALKPPFGGDGGSEERPNVILITVDTLRADHLSDYGYHLPTTPEIDRFAKEATIFTNCISPAPNTVPALASIMTSQYPSFHSAGTTNGMQAMVTDEPTLARILSENGYSTAAFVSNYVLSRKVRMYGGFDIYDDTFTSFELVRGVPERTADKTTEYVLNWLAAMTNERFFLWAHYQDPHGPYTPPARYGERFPEAAYPAGPEKLAVRDNFGKGVIPDYQYLSGHTSPSYYRARYDAEIAYADECIGRLLARVRELGLWERSIVVFTADHGESMGEHDYYFSHGHDLTDEQIHVPLIIHIPGAAQAERVDELVSSVDIPRTILAAVGLKEELGSSGLSLMPLVEGKTRRLDREYVVSEDSRGGISFRSRQTKYITKPNGERLYDLARDAHESKNLLEERPPLADDWRTIRDDYRQAASPRKGKSLYYDSEHIEKLRSLGYID